MSDPIEVVGGAFVSADAWLQAIHRAGFRAEFERDDDATLLGGTVRARLGHPSIAEDQDVLVSVDVEFFRLPRIVPPRVLEDRTSRLKRLKQLDAPSTIIWHESMVVAWITGGRGA